MFVELSFPLMVKNRNLFFNFVFLLNSLKTRAKATILTNVHPFWRNKPTLLPLLQINGQPDRHFHRQARIERTQISLEDKLKMRERQQRGLGHRSTRLLIWPQPSPERVSFQGILKSFSQIASEFPPLTSIILALRLFLLSLEK